jgi:hypothetical protein
VSRRAYVRFLIAIGVIVVVAVVFHLAAGGALRSLGEAIHGRR